MSRQPRTFESRQAVREKSGLIVGIAGASSSGKSWSAMELATGMQRVIGGEIAYIDADARRALDYADVFRFRHYDMPPPFGPLDFLDAIKQAIADGARIVCVDPMSLEHTGEGGVLWQSEDFLERKCGDNWDKREKMKMASFIKPKRERKELNQFITQARGVYFILCYRAHEKVRMAAKGSSEEKVSKAWAPDTTSDLVYDMKLRFLLKPGSNGTPNIAPAEDSEKLLVKLPEQFRGWVKSEPLTKDLGEKLARWAQGGAGANVPTKPIVCFRANVTWELNAAWSRKPIADASLDALVLYREALASALAKTDKQAARDVISSDLEAIDEAMAAKEPTRAEPDAAQ